MLNIFHTGSTLFPSEASERLKGYGAELNAALAQIHNAGISSRNEGNFERMVGNVASNSFTGSWGEPGGIDKEIVDLRADNRKEYTDLFPTDFRPGK
jgi:hypothetical protein